MGAVSRFARRAGANAARGARELFARSALPRRGAPAWLVLRLGPGLDDLAGPWWIRLLTALCGALIARRKGLRSGECGIA